MTGERGWGVTREEQLQRRRLTPLQAAFLAVVSSVLSGVGGRATAPAAPPATVEIQRDAEGVPHDHHPDREPPPACRCGPAMEHWRGRVEAWEEPPG